MTPVGSLVNEHSVLEKNCTTCFSFYFKQTCVASAYTGCHCAHSFRNRRDILNSICVQGVLGPVRKKHVIGLVSANSSVRVPNVRGYSCYFEMPDI